MNSTAPHSSLLSLWRDVMRMCQTCLTVSPCGWKTVLILFTRLSKMSKNQHTCCYKYSSGWWVERFDCYPASILLRWRTGTGEERWSRYRETVIGIYSDRVISSVIGWLGRRPPPILYQFMTAGVSVPALRSCWKEYQLGRVVFWNNSTQVKDIWRRKWACSQSF